MPDALERFDESARDAVSRGLEETRTLHLTAMPSINLLIGLQLQLGEEEKFLREEGLTIDLVRRHRDSMFRVNYRMKKPEVVGFAPITSEVFDIARKEAGDREVTSRELLLAIFRKHGGVAAQIIIGLGKTPDKLYSKLLMQPVAS